MRKRNVLSISSLSVTPRITKVSLIVTSAVAFVFVLNRNRLEGISVRCTDIDDVVLLRAIDSGKSCTRIIVTSKRLEVWEYPTETWSFATQLISPLDGRDLRAVRWVLAASPYAVSTLRWLAALTASIEGRSHAVSFLRAGIFGDLSENRSPILLLLAWSGLCQSASLSLDLSLNVVSCSIKSTLSVSSMTSSPKEGDWPSST